MFAILTEHFAGKWPLWLSPRQVMLVPIHEDAYEYCNQVRLELRKIGLHAAADLSSDKMQKKVRNAQIAQFNYILVCGRSEVTARTVNVRTRDNVVHGECQLDKLKEILLEEKKVRSLTSLFEDTA